jgi:Regulator of ribonuclease activity B
MIAMGELNHFKAVQRGRNPVTLERLVANGSDVTRPHTITSVLFVFDENDGETLRDALREAGYDVDNDLLPLTANGQRYWKLEARCVLVPTVELLGEMTDRCVELAEINGGEYDGWFTEVKRESQ